MAGQAGTCYDGNMEIGACQPNQEETAAPKQRGRTILLGFLGFLLALGVLLLIPLQPVLQSPALQPAFDNVVPALFGAMACRYYRKDPRLALVPLCAMILLFILVPSLTSSTSFMIIPSGAIAIALSWIRWRRERKEAA